MALRGAITRCSWRQRNSLVYNARNIRLKSNSFLESIADIGCLDRRVVAPERRRCSSQVSVLLWAARGRKRPRDSAAFRRLGTFVSRPLPHHPDRRDGRNRDGSASGTEVECARPIGNSALSPDRLQPAAVLGAVKAEPCGWPPRRPALTAPARGCLGRPRVGTEKRLQVEQRNWDRSKATRRPRDCSAQSLNLFSSSRQRRLWTVAACGEMP